LLEDLARQNTLCAFDFDGTLAPIVPSPWQASMRPRTRELLTQLARLYPCAIFSGRSRDDLVGKVEGIGIRELAGNHGAELARPNGLVVQPDVSSWKLALEDSLDSLPGVWIEDKGISLAVHYRQQPDKKEARRRIRRAVRLMEGVRTIGGKQVVNIIADGAPNKGEAVLITRDQLSCDWILYVGDDDNDEDAFAIEGNIVSVRVGKKRGSHARFFLRHQDEIDSLLELLIEFRLATAPVPSKSGE
jgi:trehalose 6-phosphate phosphatase